MTSRTLNSADLDTSVLQPTYDRTKLQSRIVHLGFGAFHRAHFAVFTDAVARSSNSDWGICEISLFSDRLIKALKNQDHLFSVTEKGLDGDSARVVGVVTEAMSPSLNGTQAIIEKLAEPQVSIISLTITEKGYCLDPASGQLDKTNPMIIADLATPHDPKSALGYITAAMMLRKQRGLPALSVLSCDNIQENGKIAKAAVVEFAREIDTGLANWIEAEITFPSTMVDRIVPAVTDETTADIARILGVSDPCGVVCEPFSQWVIEDNFARGRPNWDLGGAQFVKDVHPYEDMKLRMLNGVHSFLAYLGYLAGHKFIADTMADPVFRKVALDMMTKSQAPTLDMPDGTDLEAYALALIERFANPALRHKTWQIAMDGSQKIPQRFGNALRHNLAHGGDIRWLALGIAGWMKYVAGVDENGSDIDVKDPMATDLRAICNSTSDPVKHLLSLRAIFSPDIGENPDVIRAVTRAHASLTTHGARATVAAL